mmetsp:Transcript_11971/g.26469  ORF Transcript_11971/g.26469 Transcript_11971/m.26469 type:complete len:475 (-) Transcript_11971:127-1551(-)|eukprot:CAMPEP_0204258566 /NCGR_PEP_ID=MMETSP0468-20130131/5045_1 /ASSEMBLY_ACC=CAM_ASM_000383 /TAXON_ID=2969 /ORGANISM="Oxyrrhis marina" /LENGTH=474 /DNA_ID=CAMNT_0051232757 /DNA_START=19 /DNA_END=1443 /DNA_ORIENTATION=+
MRVTLCLAVAVAVTPYDLHDGLSLKLEVKCGAQWPQDPYRLFSPSGQPGTTSSLQKDGGSFVLQVVPGKEDVYYLKTEAGRFLSYTADCGTTVVDSWPEAGGNQQFKLAKTSQFTATLEALNVDASCKSRFVSGACGAGQAEVRLGSATEFFTHIQATKLQHVVNTGGCPDPFAWRRSNGSYSLICTGGDLPFWSAPALHSSTVLQQVGAALGGTPAGWASNGARWAPEVLEAAPGVDVMVVCDQQSTGEHRVGWVKSSTGEPGSFTEYSPQALDLGGQPGGDIDPHLFRDADGSTYVVWKTDDNRINLPTTRLWAQQADVDAQGVHLKGEPKMIMDSTGLWWVTSFVPDGSLVEGPEVVKRGDWYYLFFAAGRFCQDSYSEGVARSKSIWGPYEKLSVPLLSTGLVGAAPGGKLVGPGHASFPAGPDGQPTRIVWHASIGENTDRHAFVDAMKWTEDGWPVVDFGVGADEVLV